MDSQFVISTCCHLQCHNDSFLKRTAALSSHLIASNNPDQTHNNTNPSYHCEGSHCLSDSGLNTVTSHSKATATLHTSLPPQRLHVLSPGRTGILLIFFYTSVFCSHTPTQEILYIHYPSCELSITPVNVILPSAHLNKSTITPEHQSLDADPHHAITTHNPTIST